MHCYYYPTQYGMRWGAGWGEAANYHDLKKMQQVLWGAAQHFCPRNTRACTWNLLSDGNLYLAGLEISVNQSLFGF